MCREDDEDFDIGLLPNIQFGADLDYEDDDSLYSPMLPCAGPVPDAYDLETVYPLVPRRMYANGRWGCCVISVRADTHAYFEWIEQKKLVLASDADVTEEYLRETNGRNTGLAVPYSLNYWRSRGWMVQERLYKCQSFAKVSRADVEGIKSAIYRCCGLVGEFRLPMYAAKNYYRNETWTYQAKPKIKGLWGLHAMHLIGYTSAGVKARTWGTAIWMDWKFLANHGVNCYAVVDARNQ